MSDLPSQPLTRVVAREGDRTVGLTCRWFRRPDVTRALNLPDDALSGFALMINGLTPTTEAGTSVALDFYHHEERVGMLTLPLAFRRSPADNLDDPASAADTPAHLAYLRDGSPPPSLGIDRALELVRLLQRSIPPPARVVELHCGEGWLGRRLAEAGFTWHGLEGQADVCRRLLARGQPHTCIQNDTTPFESGGFDLALIADFTLDLLDPPALLFELQRIAPYALATVSSITNRSLNRQDSSEKTCLIKDRVEAALRPFYSQVETLPFGEPVDSFAKSDRYTHLLTLACGKSPRKTFSTQCGS
ncbi:MAG TPA: class I SAM-dependent methyltransferase [Opitutaceae bacterium]|nr:class I SAM-dependent methyltransferase [Opitutaceae bacterium]